MNKLELSPWDFDQSAQGWRETQKEEGPEKAADLILEYIRKNQTRIENPAPGKKL